MPITIQDCGLVTKDSSEALLYEVDYDALDNLAEGVELASVGTFTITPSGLTQSNQALVGANRKVDVLLSGGTVGTVYKVEHTVTTDETPAKIKSKWFELLITE